MLTCGEAEGKAKLSPPPRSQVEHLVPAHIVRRNKVLDEVSTAIPRDRVARNARVERLGGFHLAPLKPPTKRTKETTDYFTIPAPKSARTHSYMVLTLQLAWISPFAYFFRSIFNFNQSRVNSSV